MEGSIDRPQRRHRASVPPEQRGSGRRVGPPRPLVAARVGQPQALRLCRRRSFRSIRTGRRSGARPAIPKLDALPEPPDHLAHLHAGRNHHAAPARRRAPPARAAPPSMPRASAKAATRTAQSSARSCARRIADTGIDRGRPELHGRRLRHVQFLHRARRDPAGACAEPGRDRRAERRDGHLASTAPSTISG